MKRIKSLLISTLLFFVSFSFFGITYSQSLNYDSWVYLDIPEPSDITLSRTGNSFYIVSDDGILFETDLRGNIIRRASFTGIDFEGVYADENAIYVVDETTRKIHQFSYSGLQLERTLTFPYSGARNSGFESITYNKQKGCFILITETNPVIIFEVDSNFRQLNEIKWNQSRDVSGATWYDGHIWILSDEDMMVFKCDPLTYRPLAKWEINVLNPEGIAFDENGQMYIVSDDLERLYFFKNPERK